MKAEHLSQIQAAVAAVKERKTIRRFYFVACGGSQASMMPIQYMFDRETSIPSAIYTSNEFVKATPKVLDDTCVVLTFPIPEIHQRLSEQQSLQRRREQFPFL